ncbi:MAG: SGNH/GDSL hydrolase family protein [Planctomycetota bacterium]
MSSTRSRVAWLSLTAAVAGSACVSEVTAAPRVAGDPGVAQKFVEGNADLLILGDSINHIYMPPAYKKLSGFDVGGQLLNVNQSELFTLGMDAFFYGPDANPLVDSATLYAAGSTTTDGISGVLPAGGWGVTFGSGVVPAATNAFENVVVEARYTSPINASVAYADTQSGGAFWLDDAPDGSFDITLLTVAGPNGLPEGIANVEVYQNATLLGSAPLPSQVAAQGQLQSFTFDVPGGIVTTTGTFEATQPVSVRVRLNDGVTVNQGLNFTLAGMYASNGLEDSFGYASLALSGKRVDWFLDPNVLSTDSLATHYAAQDTNLTQIWLGENSWGQYDGQTWKSLMQDLIDKVRDADPDMDIVLVSQYDTRNNGAALKERLADYNQALFELATANERVVYLNLFEEAGDAATINAQYLLDSVHPNEAGTQYFGEVLQELYAAAALVGDFDASGSVEQGDLNLVLNNWGRDTDVVGVPEGWVLGLPEGAIDQAELNAVLNNWGSGESPDMQGLAVPEPGMAVLLLLGSAAFGRRRA